ncbi:MAG: hypothetical protein LUH15_06510 [Tannerellaceae bacterium]|nr:hypothetical protein [Tannerellaceae bacterium]
MYYLRGKKNSNLSVDYLWKNRKIKLFGETAVSQNGSFATLHGMQLTPVSYINLLMLYRYYDKKYQSFYGKSFSQQSQVQNEEGNI